MYTKHVQFLVFAQEEYHLYNNLSGLNRQIEPCHAQAGANFIVDAGRNIVADTVFENVRAYKEYVLSHAALPDEGSLGDKKRTSRIIDVSGNKSGSRSHMRLSSKEPFSHKDTVWMI